MLRVPADPSFRDALRGAQRGDEASFTWLWQQHQALLERLLALYMPAVEVSDVASETWLRALRNLSQFTGTDERAFTSWLLTIGRRIAVDNSRRRHTSECPSALLLEPESPADREQPAPDSLISSGGTALDLLAQLLAAKALEDH